ncbi:MAG: zinc ribbon domain-containing protein [Labilithrix sp.]|nr:zinc ribbon domain-containing protein [Labilithrix sp.]MCW5818196.1 zinc ribbon domain-containing protein [Labilithrix sp.]
MRVWLIFAALLALVLGWSGEARADLKVDSKWRQSALREDFTVVQWLDASCGAPPKSSTSGGGESIDIKVEGDELAFIGGGRVYRTNICYDPMPGLQRASHSRDGKTWRTRCATPPSDARKVVLNTLVVATSDTHIEIVETGRYEMSLESGKCVADVKRTRSFDAVGDTAPAAGTSTETGPSPAPAKSNAPSEAPPRPALCGVVGEAQKLEVRPSQKLLRPGETFRFRAVVLDAKGCETRTGTAFRLAPDATGKGVKVDALGNVTAAKEATEGALEIIASAGGKETRVTVEIVSAARYDELLQRSGLNAEGESDEAASVVIASQSIGADESVVEDGARKRRLVFLGIIGAALAGLLVAGIFVLRRNRRAKELMHAAEERHEERVREVLERRRRREAEHAAQQRAHEESVAAARAVSSSRSVAAEPAPPLRRADLVCASCGREMEPGTSFCPHDGTPLVAAGAPEKRGGGICPVCNTVFGSEVTRCPKDKQVLIPYPVQAMAQRSDAPRGKICPSCGERFDGGADFCGKDGTQLVLLN